ncbi:MAG: hypothetical protein ACJ8GN_24430 [Longimicrobiaceae bacterium]
MTRTSIQQFRASLVDGADQTVVMRAYRQIARRPAPADGRIGADWAVWPPAAAASTAGWVEWPSAPAAAPRLAGWGEWSAPPAPAAA